MSQRMLAGSLVAGTLLGGCSRIGATNNRADANAEHAGSCRCACRARRSSRRSGSAAARLAAHRPSGE